MSVTRRSFIKSGAIACSSAALSSIALPSFAWGANDLVRLGIIGVGKRGRGVAKVIKDLPGLTVTACCDTLPECLEEVTPHIPATAKKYKDYKALLDDKNIDAVYIASPEHLHYQMAIDAIAAGKHVYLEKTITYNIAQALELEKKVINSKVVFQVGHQYRSFPLYQKIKEAIDSKLLGNVLHFECQYHRNSDWRYPISANSNEHLTNWRLYKEYSGGLMTELSAHQIDIINWMTNDNHPLKVTGIGTLNYWKDGRDIFDSAQVVYEYPNGVKANVSSILSNQYNAYEIKILGTKGTVHIFRDSATIYPEPVKKQLGDVDGVTGATLFNATQGKPLPVEFEYPDGIKRDPTYYAFADFAKSIRENRQPLANIKVGKNVAIAAHMANISMETETYQYWKDEYN